MFFSGSTFEYGLLRLRQGNSIIDISDMFLSREEGGTPLGSPVVCSKLKTLVEGFLILLQKEGELKYFSLIIWCCLHQQSWVVRN